MATKTEREKNETIDHLLKNNTWPCGCLMMTQLKKSLLKLSIADLRNLRLIKTAQKVWNVNDGVETAFKTMQVIGYEDGERILSGGQSITTLAACQQLLDARDAEVMTDAQLESLLLDDKRN